LGLIPVVPEIRLPPDLVLLIFLPPLLYSAAFFSSPRDLKANLRPIASLSIGLVLLTTLTVASVAHLLVGLPWAAAFVWGDRLTDRPGGGDSHRRALGGTEADRDDTRG
jgi:NhaP-type Na+/H+ or K+/H+ antiporter